MRKMFFGTLAILVGFTACSLQSKNQYPIILSETETSGSTIAVSQPSYSSSEDSYVATAMIYSKTIEAQFATADYYSTLCGDTLIADWGIPSGFDNWVIIYCNSEDEKQRYAKFLNEDDGRVWIIPLHDSGLFISEDRFHLFLFTYKVCGQEDCVYLIPAYRLINGYVDGWYPLLPFHYTSGFYRLYLDNGVFETLLNPLDTSGPDYSFSLSPNEKFLAYASKQEKNVFYIRDMSTGQENKYVLGSNIENVGDFVWTPDSQKIVFVAGISGWEENQAGTILYMYDLQSSEISTLITDDFLQRVPYPDFSTNSYWVDNHLLHLVSAQYSGTWNEWLLDIRTDSIDLLPTPTRRP